VYVTLVSPPNHRYQVSPAHTWLMPFIVRGLSETLHGDLTSDRHGYQRQTRSQPALKKSENTMKNLIRTGILTLAASVGLGLAGAGAAQVLPSDTSDALLSKREMSSIVLAAEDDNDNDNDNDSSRTNTGDSRTKTVNSRTGDSDDTTNSRVTGVSRDRDRSRGDLTRDWTRVGGDHTRDFSRHLTNADSRNDTT